MPNSLCGSPVIISTDCSYPSPSTTTSTSSSLSSYSLSEIFPESRAWGFYSNFAGEWFVWGQEFINLLMIKYDLGKFINDPAYFIVSKTVRNFSDLQQ